MSIDIAARTPATGWAAWRPSERVMSVVAGPPSMDTQLIHTSSAAWIREYSSCSDQQVAAPISKCLGSSGRKTEWQDTKALGRRRHRARPEDITVRSCKSRPDAGLHDAPADLCRPRTPHVCPRGNDWGNGSRRRQLRRTHSCRSRLWRE
eukprot:COSAG03_NODE_3179_length_2159_cov_26.203398_4_plen_149_part_01